MIGIDTNILIYAHDATSPYHEDALTLMSKILQEDTVALANLSLIEFYAVMTDGRKVSNPLSQGEAQEIISDICVSSKFNVCHIDPSTFKETFRYAAEKKIKRYDIGDLFIAMSLAKSKVLKMYTANEKDFAKFDFISVLNPFHAHVPGQTHLTKTIPYGRQSIDEKDVASVCSALRSDWLTQGPKIEEFENAVAGYCGVKYAVAVSSGTAALHIACLAAGLGKGDLLWTSPNSFVASANCALYCGSLPDFVDIDISTYNMSISKLEVKLFEGEKNGCLPKIVIPVHFSGQSCDMERISALATEYGFKIIEDASHAIGGRYKDNKIGSCTFSDMTVFSFHPVKIITTGEGGMVLTNKKKLYEKLIRLRSHGITRDTQFMTVEPHGPWYYEQIELGYNYRMTDIQASLGFSQMNRLDDFVACRNVLAKRYDKLLMNLPVTLPWIHPDSYSAYHLYVIRLQIDKIKKTRRQIFEELHNAGVGVNLHYIPVHTQPYYQKLGFRFGDFPESERYYQEAISLPIFFGLTEQQQDIVVATLKETLS